MAAQLTKPYLGTPSKVFLQRIDNDEWVEGTNFTEVTAENINKIFTDEPVDTIFTKDAIFIEENGVWWEAAHKDSSFSFEFKMKPTDIKAFIKMVSPMQNLLKAVRDGRRVLGNKLHFEMSYDMYRYIQHICHRDFGCNLKRFFKDEHIKVKVRYKTKNGYWVWMK